MKLKIVLKVAMPSDKDKSKVMQIAVKIEGVSSVSIKKETDEVEVMGEGFDSVCLANSLRKKFFAHIVKVEEVKPPKPPEPTPCPPPCPPPPCGFPPPCVIGCPLIYDMGPPFWI